MALADDFLRDAQSAGGAQPAPPAGLASQFMQDAQAGAAPAAPVAAPYKPSLGDRISQGALNLLSGGVRGAGSIGATIMAPKDIISDALAGKGLSLQSNRDRRSDMDATLSDVFGAQPDSGAYQVGKLGAEVAGTMGAGGASANVLSRVAPRLTTAAPALIDAMRTGGMSANGATGAAGLAARTAGGAINGAISAGLVNPSDAGSGAAIGAVAPSVIKGVGTLAEKAGESYQQKLAAQLAAYSQKAPLNRTIADSIDAGYVLPPSSVNPTYANRVLESISGKQATQQIVSTKNTDVTSGLVRQALGLPEDASITQATLENLRKTAGKAYAEVSSLSPQAAADLEALKTARNESQGWFKAYNKSARPDDLAKAKEFRAQSEQLEAALEKHAADAGKPDLIPALRDARQQIAKTYTVGRAVNDASGTVDARVLGRMYEKGAPLTSELETVGRFASAFPTAAKSPQQIGSPDVHNLKSIAALLMGGGGSAALGPAGLAAGALPFVGPPLARAMMFRQGAQQALVSQAPEAAKAARLARLLQDPELLEMFSKASPALATGGP